MYALCLRKSTWEVHSINTCASFLFVSVNLMAICEEICRHSHIQFWVLCLLDRRCGGNAPIRNGLPAALGSPPVFLYICACMRENQQLRSVNGLTSS